MEAFPEENPSPVLRVAPDREERVRQRNRELTLADERLQREFGGRRKAVDELRRRERMYAAIFSGVGGGISLTGPDLRLRSVNQTIRDQVPGINFSPHPFGYERFHDPRRGDAVPGMGATFHFVPGLVPVGESVA